AIQAAQKNEITTFLQDAQAQSPGALDVALRTLAGKDYKPHSVIWERYAIDVKWGDGTVMNYILRWVPVAGANADALYLQ
ncbi:sugar ABC transporter substrate-binding protein, partial [Pseudomonas syringae pv. tagetis]